MANAQSTYHIRILAWYDYTSIGKIEGINNKIKVMERIAYGLRYEKYSRLRLLLYITVVSLEMSDEPKIMLRKRSIIETINDILKNVAQLVHSRHRFFNNFLINILSTLAAYCCFDKKPDINVNFNIEKEEEQLYLF